MTFLSAEEDFEIRTLAAIDGKLNRLAYLATLRGESGKYEHWGLARVHGNEAAHAAASEAHAHAFLQVLRTPVRELAAELDSSDESDQAGESVEWLRTNFARAVPVDMRGGSYLHLQSVFECLSLLSAGRKAA